MMNMNWTLIEHDQFEMEVQENKDKTDDEEEQEHRCMMRIWGYFTEGGGFEAKEVCGETSDLNLNCLTPVCDDDARK